MQSLNAYFDTYSGSLSSAFATSVAFSFANRRVTHTAIEKSDVISGAQLQKFFTDLGISPEDIVTLVLAWKVNSLRPPFGLPPHPPSSAARTLVS